MFAATDIVTVVADVGLWVMGTAVCVAFMRLVVGPDLLDRVVALDLVAMLLVGGLVLHGIAQPDPMSLRVATVLALLNFLGTVGFAIYVRRRVD